MSVYALKNRWVLQGSPSLLRTAERALGNALDILALWSERARQRRQLRRLGDHMLKDIGRSRADAEREASKPFWRA